MSNWARGVLTLAALLLSHTAATDAQPSASDWVSSAIAYGQNGRRVEPVKLGRRNTGIGVLRSFGRDPGVGLLTTPYVRVALASAHARERSMPFSQRDVTPWMLEAVVTVYLPMYENGQPEHLVIRPIDDERPASAIQPSKKRRLDPTRDAILQVGETRAGDALVADFPLSALKIGREFVMTFRLQRNDSQKVQTFKGAITEDLLTLAGCPAACR